MAHIFWKTKNNIIKITSKVTTYKQTSSLEQSNSSFYSGLNLLFYGNQFVILINLKLFYPHPLRKSKRFISYYLVDWHK